MNQTDKRHFDFCIVGSGFAGTILAMCLKNIGYSVCVIEKEKHPRFTIGESSTPIADMVLRKLAEEHELPFLYDMSRYGRWQKTYPAITCGLKRGFSYYYQKPGEEFFGDKEHSRELLVAASVDDENSDTNWLRSDVDHFLFKKAIDLGVCVMDKTEITAVNRVKGASLWEITLLSDAKVNGISGKWLIDATGSDRFSNKYLGTRSSADMFETNSSAQYSHFEGVQEWLNYLKNHESYVEDYPYHPDHSALHQMLEEGWMWMLRFNNGVLSAGIVTDESKRNREKKSDFFSIIKRYPSIHRLFDGSELAESPSEIIQTGRLQRKLDRVYGEGWLALNHSGGFVDPLHSTGIAHTLCTVERVTSLFKDSLSFKDLERGLKSYQESMFREIELIDLLVSAGYMTRRHFSLFTAAVMLYFVASVRYEQQRQRGDLPACYLCASDPDIESCIRESYQDLKEASAKNRLEQDAEILINRIKRRIEPLNSVGLMDESKHNMYTHTAVEF